MGTLFKGGTIITASETTRADLLVDGDKIVLIGEDIPAIGHMVVDGTAVTSGYFHTSSFGDFVLTGFSFNPTSPPSVDAYGQNPNTQNELFLSRGGPHGQDWLVLVYVPNSGYSSIRGSGAWILEIPASVPDTGATCAMLLFSLTVLGVARTSAHGLGQAGGVASRNTPVPGFNRSPELGNHDSRGILLTPPTTTNGAFDCLLRQRVVYREPVPPALLVVPSGKTTCRVRRRFGD